MRANSLWLHSSHSSSLCFPHRRRFGLGGISHPTPTPPPPETGEAHRWHSSLWRLPFSDRQVRLAKESGLRLYFTDPLFCSLAGTRAAPLFTPHAFWPLIRRMVAPCDPLFSAINRRNFNSTLRVALSKIQAPSAERFRSHALRRGTSQELNESGPPRSAVATSGAWHSPAFRGYVDMSSDVELGVQQLCDLDLDSESEAEALLRLLLEGMRGIHRSGGLAAFPWLSGFPESVRRGLLAIGVLYVRLGPMWPSPDLISGNPNIPHGPATALVLKQEVYSTLSLFGPP